MEWVKIYRIASTAFVKAGGRNGYLHVQAVARICMMPNEVGRKAMRHHIKEFIPVGGTVKAKPLEAGQSFTYMLGYFFEDTGMPHYRMKSYKVAEDELQEDRRVYDEVKVDFTGKIAIITANLIKHMYTFYMRYAVGHLDLRSTWERRRHTLNERPTQA